MIFQPTSEQAKYGASDILKKSKVFYSFPLRLIISDFFIVWKLCFDSFNTVYRSLSCKQRHTKLDYNRPNCFTNDTLN